MLMLNILVIYPLLTLVYSSIYQADFLSQLEQVCFLSFKNSIYCIVYIKNGVRSEFTFPSFN